jgi:hypothetical protein
MVFCCLISFAQKETTAIQGTFHEAESKDMVAIGTPTCDVSISDYFCPTCQMDTTTHSRWVVSYPENCGITSVVYKVYSPDKKKVIYKSTAEWRGKDEKTGKYYPQGNYPFEIKCFSKNKVVAIKKGKVFLHLYDYIKSDE